MVVKEYLFSLSNLFTFFIQVRKERVAEAPEKKYHPSVRRDSISSFESTNEVVQQSSGNMLHQPVFTPSIFDQSMLNWQNLQVGTHFGH